ncbi:MAG: response regulator transcription factor [Nitrospirae bacterium]|nr:response regulator transcription factor [Nitrospirota bacterium]
MKNKTLIKDLLLIVEDHDALRESLQKWLSTFFPELDFLEAGSGEDALNLVKEHKPGIVLMDIKLPQMSGIEATRQIKEMLPDTNIVILSMYDFIDYKTEALAAGASAYVAKNRMYSELVPIIKKFLSS